jgi:hypothetical protein
MPNKKYLFIFLLPLFLVSCKKEYQCQCTNSNNTYDAGDTVTARTKGGANRACDELSSADTKCQAK